MPYLTPDSSVKRYRTVSHRTISNVARIASQPPSCLSMSDVPCPSFGAIPSVRLSLGALRKETVYLPPCRATTIDPVEAIRSE